MVHGGPHAQSTQSFNELAQFLVSRGYTVFQPNYRGSTGRGSRRSSTPSAATGAAANSADIANGGRSLEWTGTG